METNRHQNKPSNPAPPLNAKKTLGEKPRKKAEQPVRRSVYDEIAERRKLEKQKIGVTSHQDGDEPKYLFGGEVKQIREDDDVKVYTPSDRRYNEEIISHSDKAERGIAEYPTDIYSDDGRETEAFDNEDNYDVPPIPKTPRRIGLWVALITALSVLCVIAAGAYGIVNGYFDGIISML